MSRQQTLCYEIMLEKIEVEWFQSGDLDKNHFGKFPFFLQ